MSGTEMNPRLYLYASLSGLVLMLTACGQAAPDYYPLTPGHWWQYDMRLHTMDGERRAKQVVRNVGRREEQGQQVYFRESSSGLLSRYQITQTGIQRSIVSEFTEHQPVAFATVLGLPLKQGTEWTGSITTSVLEKTGPPQDTLFRIRETVEMNYRIESVSDSVVVNGEQFQNCIRVNGSGSVNADVGNYIGRLSINVESDDWYAPGIGLVKSRHLEKTDNETISGGEYFLTLEHYSH